MNEWWTGEQRLETFLCSPNSALGFHKFTIDRATGAGPSVGNAARNEGRTSDLRLTCIAIFVIALVTPSASAAHPLGAVQAKPAGSTAAPKNHQTGCSSARRGLAFYRIRASQWKILRGAKSEVRLLQPRGCAHTLWLAKEWRQRSFWARQAYYRWSNTIGQVIARLDVGLEGSPMEGTGSELEQAGRRHHVSPYFMAAVAATESSLGHAACSNNRFNVWGLANCTGIWYVPAFGSWAEAYAFYAKFLASRWPSHSSPYSFNGYAACDDCWARKVSEWMSSLFRVTPLTRYP